MITGDLSKLTDVRPLARHIPISVATRCPRAFVTARGNLHLKADDGSPISVPNVFYLAQAHRTLISIPEVMESGGSWQGRDGVMELTFKDGCRVTSVYSDRKWAIPLLGSEELPNHPATIQFDAMSTLSAHGAAGARPAASDALKWHCRFGHASMRTIQKLMKHQLATGLPLSIESTPFTCVDCLKSKSLRSITLSPTCTKPEPLELIVSDVAGPFDPSAQGARYMVVFRDVATSYAEVWCIAKRDQVPKMFAGYVERMERATGRKVKVLRGDGAGEYTSKSFNAWCAEKGIVNQQTNRYKHHQNGIAERLIRTISNMGRTMLHAAGFGEEMWAFAHTAAAHVHNRIPNQVTGLKTPYEALFGKKPHLEYLRTFGEPAVVHVPCEIRRKLDQRGKLMLMVGYPSGKKGWSFWDPQSKKLTTVESSLARFLSDGPPVVEPPREPQPNPEASKVTSSTYSTRSNWGSLMLNAALRSKTHW